MAASLMQAGLYAASHSVILAWDSNGESDVEGYILYYGLRSRQYSQSVNVGSVTTNLVNGLSPGATYFFAVTAYNSEGLESDFSNEISYSVPASTLPVSGLPAEFMLNKNNTVLLPFTIGGVADLSNASLGVTSSKPLLLPIRSTTLQGSGTNWSLLIAPARNKSGRATLTLTATSGGETLQHTIAVTVTASNNPPTMVPSTDIATWKQMTAPLIGVKVSDPDTTTGNLRLTLTVSNGTLKALTTVRGGITADQIRGNSSKRLIITAPAAAINRTFAARNGVVYRGNLNFVGGDGITAVLSDLGNTGLGGAKSCLASSSVNVQGNDYDWWRILNFSEADLRLRSKQTSVWGDNADPDTDGRDNLMEYALGSSPYVKQPSTNGLNSALLETNAAAHLSLTFNRRVSPTILSYVPEVSTDGQTWSSDAVEVLQVQPLDSSLESVTCRDTVPVNAGEVRLMRLRITNAP